MHHRKHRRKLVRSNFTTAGEARCPPCRQNPALTNFGDRTATANQLTIGLLLPEDEQCCPQLQGRLDCHGLLSVGGVVEVRMDAWQRVVDETLGYLWLKKFSLSRLVQEWVRHPC